MPSTFEKIKIQQKEEVIRTELRESRVCRRNLINAIGSTLDQNFTLSELTILYDHLLKGHRMQFITS